MRRWQKPGPEDLYRPTPAHPPETIARLEAIPIREIGEPLVALADACPAVELVPPGRKGRHARLKVRASVAVRLGQAQAWLDTNHTECRLVVTDGYRSLEEQARYFRLARYIVRLLHPFWPAELVREAANKYVAAPDGRTPPPHTTGGAVDVTLRLPTGELAYMGPRGFSAARTDYPHLPPQARRNREILSTAMTHAGFSNYEEEWWHWSYGDSGWALRTHQPAALYGGIVSAS